MKGTGKEATEDTDSSGGAEQQRRTSLLPFRRFPPLPLYARSSRLRAELLSPDTVAELQRRGHTLRVGGGQGVAQLIVYNGKEDMLEGGTDHRASDGGVVGVSSPGHRARARLRDSSAFSGSGRSRASGPATVGDPRRGSRRGPGRDAVRDGRTTFAARPPAPRPASRVRRSRGR